MIRFYTKSIFLAGAVMCCAVFQAQAQEDLDQLLEAGLEDANILVEGYLAPALRGFGMSLSNGWYNTAAAHKPLGFELIITANAAYVPDEELFYIPRNLNNTALIFPDQAPTIFGTDDETAIPRYAYTYQEEVNGTLETFTGTFDGPEGLNVEDEIGLQAVPVPMVNLGIGIVKNTDLKIRWTPEIDVGDDGNFKLIGFGLLHDIKQHIPGLKRVPFNLSVFVGFTDVTSEITFEEDDPSSGVTTDDGRALFDVNTWTFQALASKKFSVLTIYGGLGYNVVNSELDLEGEYVVFDDFGQSISYVDPISLSFESSGFRATAGLRLKFGVFSLHTDYTFQEYNTLTVGIGFGFREQKFGL
ncbi:MAG: DUF6588 family protein [Bacteroidota bacterium]